MPLLLSWIAAKACDKNLYSSECILYKEMTGNYSGQSYAA